MRPVEIYTARYCPYCHWAKELLKRKGVDFTEFDVTGDPELRRAMTLRAGGANTVPQIFVGETHIGGCDDLYALEEAGRLDSLLNGAACQ
jgi:glutaredoxin 3